jgi:acyl-coenzyme A thioesterase PaaI-like protein
MHPVAFQDQIPDNLCYGCGPGNPSGLRIKSYWDGDETVCTFKPGRHHSAGPEQFVNGGIIATIVDCHSVCTAIAHAYRAEGRPIGSEPGIWCVTASLNVTYLRPSPITGPLTLRASVAETGPKKLRVHCSVRHGEDECARAEVIAVRVPHSWREAGHRGL